MNEIYSVAKVPALAGVVHGVDTSHYSEACGQDATVATTTAAAHSCTHETTTYHMIELHTPTAQGKKGVASMSDMSLTTNL
jgi:hypothetical protein